ncbi:heme peroxidase [Williamsia sp. MIQD14]|uniref:heme peroxidase n=1 Tax=Williamsia sp. MIQD14 TaxID=3425703 RepID=UPI003DA0AC5A
MSGATDLDKLAGACRDQLGPQSEWFRPNGYPDSLALCIIDSIQSTGAHYNSVLNVVNRYRELRADAAATDGTAELLASFDQLGGARNWAKKVGNFKAASTKRGASLKADVMHDVAQKLHDAGIRMSAQFREHGELAAGNEDRRAALKKLWTSAEAQRSGITFEYALMLAGLPGVKSDRMVLRFVSTAIGRSDLTPTTCATLVRDAADHLGVDATTLDHAIWRKASGRANN